MKVKGHVVETILVVKDVEVDVPDKSGDTDIEKAIRNEAYASTLQDMNGWELTDTLDVEITWEEKEEEDSLKGLSSQELGDIL